MNVLEGVHPLHMEPGGLKKDKILKPFSQYLKLVNHNEMVPCGVDQGS